jgi:hypothetical protein
MTSEASIPEPLNVFIYRGETKDAIPTKNLTHVRVDPSVKEIQKKAFRNCRSLVKVEFFEGLEQIGSWAFIGCQNLKHVNKLPSTLQEIGDYGFSCCYNLDSIELPEGLQVVGRSAFWECSRLERIKIPSAHVVIKSHAFCACIRLTSVDLPEGLQAIGEGWFAECTSLTHVRIPSSVVRIESTAFVNCTQLVSLELPEGLEILDLNGSYNDYGSLDGYYMGHKGPNISGCESLVNLVIPSEQHVEQLYYYDDEEFMENLKLGTVVNNFHDLVSKLQHRFDALPVHRLCYYQSYHPLTEALENLRKSIDADPSAGTKVDSFGMTPFHILALAQKPNLSLFQALMNVYKVDIIHTRDKFGSTPFDYLCLNHTSDDSAMLIESLLQRTIVQRIQWLGLARWKADISTGLDLALGVLGWSPEPRTIQIKALAAGWSFRKREIGVLHSKLAAYERLESISLLALALWKVKIDDCKVASETDDEREEESSPKRPRLDKAQLDGVDRQSCRINSGADVVISNVLPYLDKVCREDYCVAD